MSKQRHWQNMTGSVTIHGQQSLGMRFKMLNISQKDQTQQMVLPNQYWIHSTLLKYLKNVLQTPCEINGRIYVAASPWLFLTTRSLAKERATYSLIFQMENRLLLTCSVFLKIFLRLISSCAKLVTAIKQNVAWVRLM